MSNFSAIVLSAGSGSRMKSDIPKQYMDLKGYPVIYYSLKAFHDSSVSSIVLVVGENDIEFVKKEIVEKYCFDKVRAVVAGGKERYDSVYNGLLKAEDADYVMIHDGARPMLSLDIINRCMDEVEKYSACVAAMPVKDTIKVSNAEGYAVETPDRNSLWAIQTPQCFSYSLIMRSYDKLYSDLKEGKLMKSITDDAMVVEYGSDVKARLTEGDYSNIKITTPEDIAIAEILLK